MLCFDGINFYEGVDVNKTSALKQCNISPYWCILNYSFNFQTFSGINVMVYIAILNFKGSNYHCITSLISKNEVKHLQNADFTQKSRTL